ncbi:MAG TPA: choice-of-anchor D domain-containing protein, partial [Planctomycetota bacterium]|nr:choice-of-anchor D domain-containing protein [Planctomycetota bacterium]
MPAKLTKGDLLTLNLFKDAVYTARIVRVTVNAGGTVTVQGSVEGYPLGYVLLSTTRDRTLGTIHVPEKGKRYAIQSDAEAKAHYVLEVDPKQERVLEDGPPLIPPRRAAGMEPRAAPAGDATTPATIDVMVVYTPAARQWADSSGGGIANVIAQAMSNAQMTHSNSQTLVTLRLVHSAEVSYVESGDSGTDLDRLTSTTDGHMDEVHSWRNTYGADLVALFSRVEDTGGIGWLLSSASGNPNNAFCITRVQQAANTYTHVHEMGHNMGCHHRRDQTVQPGPGLFSYSAGWHWTGADGGKYCSVMSYTDGGYTTVAYFSDPNIKYQDRATGTSNDDNARTIREVKDVIAAYRSASSAPANDHFANATAISQAKGQTTGYNAGATKETEEPNHAGNAGGRSVWWRWAAPASGDVTLHTFGSSFDTLLAVYTGSSVGALTVVASNDNAPGSQQSRVAFTAVAGATYWIAVDGYNGATGNIVLDWDLATSGPQNDHFANAISVSGASGQTTGTNVGATKEAGEPSHAGNAGGRSVWWRWTPSSSGQARINTFGSGFDTLLAVYTGSSVSALTAVASNDDAGGPQSQVTFAAVAGAAYRIAVDGYNGVSGSIVVDWALTGTGPPNDHFANATAISGTSGQATGTNASATKETGEPNHAGNAGGRSVWWRWTASSSGEATINTFGSNFNTLLAVYTGGSVGSLALVASNDDEGDGLLSQVSFTAVAGTTYRIAVDGYSGVSGNIVLDWNLTGGGPANDHFANATAISGTSGQTTGTNNDATKEAGEPNHAGNAGGASVWWRWTAPSSGQLTVSTFGSRFDTLLAVYTGTSVAALTRVASNDDAGGGLQSRVTANVTAGTTYRIAVDGYSGVSGNIVLDWNLTGGGPANDHFANATAVSGTSGQTTGSNANATKETGEPDHAGNAGGRSVWWRWTAPSSGEATINTFGSGFDTLLAVYTGSSVGALTLVASNDDSGGDVRSQVTFIAVAGTTYRIAVDGYGGGSGNIILNWSLTGTGPANDHFANATAISGTNGRTTGSNANATKETGEPDHAYDAGGASVWWRWTAPSSGEATFDTFGSDFDTLLAVYTGSSVGALTLVAENDDAALGFQSQVTFTTVAGTTYRIAVDGYDGETGDIVLNWSATGGGPANDDFANATAVSGTSGQATGTNANATKETGEPNHAGNAGGASVWWRWTAPSGGDATINTFGSDFDTLIAVYTGSSVGALTLVASNDDTGGLQSQVTFTAVAGTTYRIAVDGYGGDSGGIVLNWTLTAPTTRIIRLVGDLAFGNVVVNTTATRTLTVYNDGNSTLSVSGITYPSGFSGSWSSGPIAAGGSQAVTVTFSPMAAQTYSGTVTVSSDRTSGTDTVACSGTGTTPPPQLVVEPAGDVDFGQLPVGTSSEQDAYTVRNSGGGTLAGTVSVATPFNLVSGGTFSLAAGASQVVRVRFTPPARTSYSQPVSFASNAGNASRTVRGSGGPVTLVIDNRDNAADRRFGVVSGTWSTSTWQTNRWAADYHYTSTGTGSSVAAWYFTLPEGGIYDVSAWWPDGHSAWGSNVPYRTYHRNGNSVVRRDQRSNGGQWNALGTCEFVAGTEYRVEIANDSPSTYVLADAIRVKWVREAVPVLSVAPAGDVDFGQVLMAAQKELDAYTATNTGEGTLSGTVSVPSPFSVVSGGTLDLGPGASQVVRIRFAPAAEANYSESVSFASNGGTQARTVTGSGVASLPSQLVVEPAGEVDFGQLPVGTSSE